MSSTLNKYSNCPYTYVNIDLSPNLMHYKNNQKEIQNKIKISAQNEK